MLYSALLNVFGYNHRRTDIFCWPWGQQPCTVHTTRIPFPIHPWRKGRRVQSRSWEWFLEGLTVGLLCECTSWFGPQPGTMRVVLLVQLYISLIYLQPLRANLGQMKVKQICLRPWCLQSLCCPQRSIKNPPNRPIKCFSESEAEFHPVNFVSNSKQF